MVGTNVDKDASGTDGRIHSGALNRVRMGANERPVRTLTKSTGKLKGKTISDLLRLFSPYGTWRV